jgi:hypothetical protein
MAEKQQFCGPVLAWAVYAAPLCRESTLERRLVWAATAKALSPRYRLDASRRTGGETWNP